MWKSELERLQPHEVPDFEEQVQLVLQQSNKDTNIEISSTPSNGDENTQNIPKLSHNEPEKEVEKPEEEIEVLHETNAEKVIQDKLEIPSTYLNSFYALIWNSLLRDL